MVILYLSEQVWLYRFDLFGKQILALVKCLCDHFINVLFGELRESSADVDHFLGKVRYRTGLKFCFDLNCLNVLRVTGSMS